ncbi:AglZ/HisF2 family acetamidino modification protein [Pseudoalteromonas sp. meg-B1]|uniref:AglZ/HisF2 family acetamidino modification protein n=1 Tax=Pseudoalteromonas sp. meg-B1 TaxID=2203192 RepID=UPI000D6FF954|nr:AglZ/HisF2 family acetamidino modification protein [Pseudoalteromonas sp. meg-B1]PWS54347.1 imidazole glycerol phosphate synthase subunit HisF [Pseudoalteromonas sp. meg-B1]
MLSTRVIPCLLLQEGGIVKTKKFKKPRYIGDPINVVKILNEKEVDELIFLDIDASPNKSEPDYELIKTITNECFMPFSYGGGITSLEQASNLFNLGVEKVIIGSHAIHNKKLITDIASQYGNQSVVATMNIKRDIFKKPRLYDPSNKKMFKIDLSNYCKELVNAGAGEIFLNFVDRDGMKNGYDGEGIRSFSELVNVPITVCGGASCLEDMRIAVKDFGASAVAAGSLFVYHGKRDAVLVNYPDYSKLLELFK